MIGFKFLLKIYFGICHCRLLDFESRSHLWQYLYFKLELLKMICISSIAPLIGIAPWRSCRLLIYLESLVGKRLLVAEWREKWWNLCFFCNLRYSWLWPNYKTTCSYYPTFKILYDNKKFNVEFLLFRYLGTTLFMAIT